MVRFNETVIAEELHCSGQITCDSIQTTNPPPSIQLPSSVQDWTVTGNLAAQGRSTFYVASAQYMTSSNLTVANTLPAQDATYDLGSSTAAFATVHAAQVLQTSSAKKKTDIENCPVGIDFIAGLHPVAFTGPTGRRQYGFVAEEVAATDSVVATSEAIDYTAIIAPLVNAIRQLKDRVEALEQQASGKSTSGAGD